MIFQPLCLQIWRPLAQRRTAHRPRLLLAACGCLLLSPLASAADSSIAAQETPAVDHSPPRLIFISWDGTGDALIDRMLAEDRLPHLAQLAAQGTRTRHVVGTWPSKTAASHASLFTGCGPGVNGVAANRTTFHRDP
ncbi:MAG: alkaline phosphatase family protein, partial [Acidobacteriota bacterium]